jgi:hypothetical protein
MMKSRRGLNGEMEERACRRRDGVQTCGMMFCFLNMLSNFVLSSANCIPSSFSPIATFEMFSMQNPIMPDLVSYILWYVNVKLASMAG